MCRGGSTCPLCPDVSEFCTGPPAMRDGHSARVRRQSIGRRVAAGVPRRGGGRRRRHTHTQARRESSKFRFVLSFRFVSLCHYCLLMT